MSSHPHERPMLASVQNTIEAAKHVHFPSTSQHKAVSSVDSASTSSGRNVDDESLLSENAENHPSGCDTPLASTYLKSTTPMREASSIPDNTAAPAHAVDETSKPQTLPGMSNKTSAFVRPASVAGASSDGSSPQKVQPRAMASSSSFHANLAAGLLTPTLASALGISTNRKKWRPSPRRQHTSPSASSSSGRISLARNPSIPPSLQRAGGRTSVCSIASFESLPEDEVPATDIEASCQRSNRTIPMSQSCYDISSAASLDHPSWPVASALQRGENREHASPGGKAHIRYDLTKRRMIVKELLETERTFVTTLQIINDHYYQPLLALSRGHEMTNGKALSSASPVLSRNAVTEIFSNFFDILRLNTELLNRLEERLAEAPPSDHPQCESSRSHLEHSESRHVHAIRKSSPSHTDHIGDLLVTMAPFLKMYSFYVKNFSNALARIESESKSDANFARFLKETDKSTWMAHHDGRGGGIGFGLGLQAHLLAIVQRIPRYRLLVGELVQCTPTSQRDHKDLVRAYQVIEQVASSINENVRQHELVLQMLEIQRQLIGLPFPLIVPGRSLLKRGTLLKGGRRDINVREFFLFTDCIIYAAPNQGTMADASAAAWYALSRYGAAEQSSGSRPGSAASRYAVIPGSPTKRLEEPRRRTTSFPTRVSAYRISQSLDGQQLQFREKLALQDCTVVAIDDAVALESGLRHCFEIHSPGRSFAVYAESQDCKDDWIQSIRSAREEWQSNRRTLQAEEDSIQAKRDKRRSLMAMQSQNRLQNTSPPTSDNTTGLSTSELGRQRRGSMPSLKSSTSTALLALRGGAQTVSKAGLGLKVLDDYNAPVWVPDSLADKCACCCETFGIWRRKHHCRLCGKVVCWSCSSRNFLIASYEDGEQDRPARACDPCYDSVFAESASSTIRPASSMRNMRNSLRPDSEVSTDPSGPVTPASSSNHIVSPKSMNDNDTPPINIDLIPAETRQKEDLLPTLEGECKSDGYLSPATRIAKAAVDDAKLFQGSLLSPRVHAATSGSGTFRLVTPRLTTPDREVPLASRWRDAGGQAMKEAAGRSEAGLDYFAGAADGQTELPTLPASATPQGAATTPSSAEPRTSPADVQSRRKPLSAAARLSVYSAVQPSPSTTTVRRVS